MKRRSAVKRVARAAFPVMCSIRFDKRLAADVLERTLRDGVGFFELLRRNVPLGTRARSPRRSSQTLT